MKNHLIYTLSGMLFLLTSCDAFLNQEPLDQLAPDEYMTTETNVASYANDQYQMLPTHGTYGYGTFESDQHTDNGCHATQYSLRSWLLESRTK